MGDPCQHSEYLDVAMPKAYQWPIRFSLNAAWSWGFCELMAPDCVGLEKPL